jgi:serine phosphatase RsbU (regulator of sigma subunit)
MIVALPSILASDDEENIDKKTNAGSLADQSLLNYFNSFPSESELRKLIKNSFVINRPLSTVGGDGYWINYSNKSLYVVVFDCMGHGRLAAIMTRIYINAIKKTIFEKKINDPALILTSIHEEIEIVFKNKDDVMLGSGADVAVLRIDTIDKKLFYAGAKLDMIAVINNELVRCKSHKRQVGTFFHVERTYQTEVYDFKTSKISSIYLFSDGLTDLIGGPEERKLTYKNLENKLVEIKKEPMSFQKKEIEKLIERWQGVNPAVDDILVLGFTF